MDTKSVVSSQSYKFVKNCHKKTLRLLLPASFYGRLCRICSYGGSAFDYLFRSDGQNNKLAVTKISLIKKDRIIHLNIHAR